MGGYLFDTVLGDQIKVVVAREELQFAVALDGDDCRRPDAQEDIVEAAFAVVVIPSSREHFDTMAVAVADQYGIRASAQVYVRTDRIEVERNGRNLG